MSFTVRLDQVRQLSPSTRDFVFVRTDGQSVDYEPGQFFRFEFEDDTGSFERSYTLCNFNELHGAKLDLVISEVEGGRATRLLFSEDIEGLQANVTGPFGRLVLPAEVPDRLIMVATSVGLAPYMPILKKLESLQYPNVVLLLGVRDRTEFIYGQVLQDYAERHSWFQLRLCLSREAANAPYEFDGYVYAQFDDLGLNAEHDHVLLCGNPKMIDDAWSSLKEKGFRARQVVREKYVFAKEAKTKEAKTESKGLTDEQKRLIQEKMNKYK